MTRFTRSGIALVTVLLVAVLLPSHASKGSPSASRRERGFVFAPTRPPVTHDDGAVHVVSHG